MNDENASLRRIVAAVLTDLRAVNLAPDVAVFDLAEQTSIVGAGPAPDGYDDEGHVIRVGGSTHLLGRDAEGEPDLVEVVSFLQDWVIDELNAGWPERIGAEGEFIELLQPAMVDGVVAWTGHAGRVAAVGELSSVPIRTPDNPPRPS
jgi:hypothetical protein